MKLTLKSPMGLPKLSQLASSLVVRLGNVEFINQGAGIYVIWKASWCNRFIVHIHMATLHIRMYIQSMLYIADGEY